MKFPFFASFVIFLFILHHNMRKGSKTWEQEETAFWQHEFSANGIRKHSLDDLNYISFKAEPFYPITLLSSAYCSEFLERNPEVTDFLSQFLSLENKKIVNLSQFSNTELKYQYGVANLEILTEYDTNYTDLITLLHNYGMTFYRDGYENQALAILEYAISIGSDISATYMTCAEIYQNKQQWNQIEQLKKEAENIPTSRKNVILRKLNESFPNLT